MDQVSRTIVSYFCVPGVVYSNGIHLTFDPTMGYNLMLLRFYTTIAPLIIINA